MKVLIFGASGIIGFPVAQALSRAGHIVHGVTRSETKARRLAVDEIFPIIGEPTNTQTWGHLIPTIDVVIEAVGGNADLHTMALTLLNAVGDAAKSTQEVVSDTTPPSDPLPIDAWRPSVEETVRKDPRVNGIVIRPGGVYGKTASMFDSVFEAAESGRQVAWYGKPGVRFALIHADDLADLYVRVVEKAPILGGLAINACNDTTESIDDFLQRLIHVSGAKGPHEWIEPTNPFEDALASTVLCRPYLARSLLGWQQRKPGFIDGLPLYYSAWKAFRSNYPKEKL